ncbi:MAG: nitrate reductase maturation protein NarM [Leptolyngbya sp. SIO1D8]|nr:nitrate reductase maturation protein NarM [Leptolyngbya sp. SIO1D8]
MTTSDLTFFQFETDFVRSLRCIPMQVRYKLDNCGIKLKLEHWHRFTTAEREQLVALPCASATETAAYRNALQTLIAQHTNVPAKEIPIDPQPPWSQTKAVPPDVQAQASQVGTAIAQESWANLTPLQRFALCKLSRPSHENRNFAPALREFNLVEASNMSEQRT